jgi:large subunit ribosomal protein L14
MPGAKFKGVGGKGVSQYRPKIARGLPTGAIMKCADNTGAKELRVIQVIGYKGRLRRIPAAAVGDMLTVSVKRGTPDMRRQMFPAVAIRQRVPFRRRDGTVVQFEDNAAVVMTPEGELKGTAIKGPVAKEAAEKWPRIASVSSIIV